MIEAKGVNGTVTFDGRTVTISRSGFLARATVGKGTKSIPVRSVAAVQFKPAGMGVRGFIQFTVPGGVEGRSRFGKQSIDAAKDENSVLFGRTQRAEFEALRDAVQAVISGDHAPTPTPATEPQPQGPPPGWYADPTGERTQRWWDGTAWTDHAK